MSNSVRVRIRFSKTRRAIFTSHVDLPVIFGRAARRAGLVPELTQGFTPRPRLAIGPPLPVGVVGLAEPAEFWFSDWSDEMFSAWRSSMPEGIDIRGARVEGEGPSLSKLCVAMCCKVEARGAIGANDALASWLDKENVLLDINESDGAIFVCTREVDRIGPAKFVSCLQTAGVISGWDGVSITRLAVGGWNEENRSVTHLVDEC